MTHSPRRLGAALLTGLRAPACCDLQLARPVRTHSKQEPRRQTFQKYESVFPAARLLPSVHYSAIVHLSVLSSANLCCSQIFYPLIFSPVGHKFALRFFMVSLFRNTVCLCFLQVLYAEECQAGARSDVRPHREVSGTQQSTSSHLPLGRA